LPNFDPADVGSGSFAEEAPYSVLTLKAGQFCCLDVTVSSLHADGPPILLRTHPM
jgi:hypothetical protein